MRNYTQINRRLFIQTTGLASAAASLWDCGTLSCDGAERVSPAVAVFSKVYQEMKLTFEESAEVTAQAGLDGIDCVVRPGGEILPERAAEEMPRYAEALQKQKVRMLLLTTGIVGVSSPNTEDILRTARKLGVRYYRLGFQSHRAGTAPEKLQASIKAQLKELAALNKEIGVCAIFQNHSSTKGRALPYAGGDLGELYTIIKDFNPEEVAVAFDLGHALLTHGDGWKAHFEKLKPHIKIIYIKDTKRSVGFVPFGEGEFSQTDFFQQLKKMKYQAPFSMHIEFDWAGKGNPKTREALVKALKDSRRVLDDWFARA